jgi:hypothetical protein
MADLLNDLQSKIYVLPNSLHFFFDHVTSNISIKPFFSLSETLSYYQAQNCIVCCVPEHNQSETKHSSHQNINSTRPSVV